MTALGLGTAVLLRVFRFKNHINIPASGLQFVVVIFEMASHLEEHLDNFEFDIQLVKSLVQRIEVSADKRIRIIFGFRDVFAEVEKESAEK